MKTLLLCLLLSTSACASTQEPVCDMRSEVLAEVESQVGALCTEKLSEDEVLCQSGHVVSFHGRPEGTAVVFYNARTSSVNPWGSVFCPAACSGPCETWRGGLAH